MFNKNKNQEPTYITRRAARTIIALGAAAGAALGLNVASAIHDGGSDVPPVVGYNGQQGQATPELPPQPTVVPPTTLEPPATLPPTSAPPHGPVELPK